MVTSHKDKDHWKDSATGHWPNIWKADDDDDDDKVLVQI
jgi:hypothetical protein